MHNSWMINSFFILGLSAAAAVGHTESNPNHNSPAYQQEPSLSTQTGHILGLTVSDYVYKEPSLGVKITSTKIGFDYNGTIKLDSSLFLKADFRYATGKAEYSGSGTQDDEDDWYFDARGLIATDLAFLHFSISPYAGLGFRHLYNDSRGTTSTGHIGYRRESNYFYIPFGLTHRINLTQATSLETTFEYDHLVRGTQISYLSDTEQSTGYYHVDDTHNTQSEGFGLRFSSMVKMDNLAFGPYITYWDIKQSDTVATQTRSWGGQTSYLYVFEPKNSTLETGFKVSYQF